MFNSLSDRLNDTFDRLRGKGKLTEADITSAMRDIRMALLEADVNFKVVKEFVAKTKERCMTAEVMESLSPAQNVVKIVLDELTEMLGSTESKLVFSNRIPNVIMLVGLQGSGKTTHSAKLALHFKNQGKRPLLVACDVYRPAAIDQLKVVGEKANVPVFEVGQGDPVEIAKKAAAHAKDYGNDLVILDTAGRLHIDEELMGELSRIKETVSPQEILLVIDAMVGQDAVNVAKTFNETVGVDGIILTKTDGDTRGGAALSVLAVTGKPIKFQGTGEKLDMIELFHPDRMASRILGMGDMLTFIEKAEQQYDEEQARKLEEKLKKNRLTLTDYMEQMDQLQKMGNLGQIAGMLPGDMGKQLDAANLDEKQLGRTRAIIQSMTPLERENPSILNASRKKRIAAGCGMQVSDVNRLLKSFEMLQQLTKSISKGRFGGFGGPGGMPTLGKAKKGKLQGFGRKKRLK